MVKKSQSLSHKGRRKKGHAYERKVANDFRKLGWVKCKRHLEYQSGEAELGQDLDNTYPFLVQCKAKNKAQSPNSLLDQIKEQEGCYKLGVLKIDNKGEYAIMKWSDLQELLQMLKSNDVF